MKVEFERVRRDDPEVEGLYADFIREADAPLGIDIDADIVAGPPEDVASPNGVLLLVRIEGQPAGLGGVRHLDTPVAEVKSMYIAPRYRKAGVARRLLTQLERIAAERGCGAIRLDTSDYLTGAIALYRAAGYREVPAYNRNPKASLWFERKLESETDP